MDDTDRKEGDLDKETPASVQSQEKNEASGSALLSAAPGALWETKAYLGTLR